MFNGDIASQKRVHVCSHQGLPCEQRHCCDRDVAVERCTDSLLDLLMSSMPSIPTPNKWTTIFGPLEFVLAGFILHGWLRQVFEIAFQGMTFSEFDETKETTDPKLIEALCFHAVNGKRHGSSLKFLQSADASWAIGLLAITLEPNRVLTWHWLSCLGKSLKHATRPPLYSLIDRRSSIIIQVLQHYSSLLLNPHGDGRLNLLWSNTPYESFADFCENEPARVRELRGPFLQNTRPFFTEHEEPSLQNTRSFFIEHETLFYRTRRPFLQNTGTRFTEHEPPQRL
jgi:hypothetical protein